MKTLDYKGVRSTRFAGTAVIFSAACLFLALGLIEAETWAEVVTWTWGLYAGSEVGAKASSAYAEAKRPGGGYVG